jgi:hypothetical protein
VFDLAFLCRKLKASVGRKGVMLRNLSQEVVSVERARGLRLADLGNWSWSPRE